MSDRGVYIGIGGNLGDRLANLRDGLRHLQPRATVEGVSSLYETEPVGGVSQPSFYNAVCRLRTERRLEDLLAELKRIERVLGRRPGLRWGPRPLDLDILLAGDTVAKTPTLQVPHPRLTERAFVLVPLAEIAPALIIPGTGETVSAFSARVDGSGVARVAGPEWWTDFAG